MLMNCLIRTGNYDSTEVNEIARLAVRRFLERYRKKHKKSVRHWLITELGHERTERLHLHGLIWTNHIEEIAFYWNYGFIWKGDYTNQQTINYIVKYVTKTDKKHPNYKPKILCSPGIGKNYINTHNAKLNQYKNEETKQFYITKQGLKLALPGYYRKKLYSDEERENLWLNSMKKNVRFICGEEIPAHITEQAYKRILQFYQAKNQRLGYGTNKKDIKIETFRKKT